MWESHCEELARDVLRYTLSHSSLPISFADFIRRLQLDGEFRTFLNTCLASCPFHSFRWETPAFSTRTAEFAFEFVLLDSPGLARQPDPTAFASQFGGVGHHQEAIEFPNLSGDAILIVPCPKADPVCYGHLGAFVRLAPEPQQQAFWERVGIASQRRLNQAPVWLNTAGAGVAWLHVRLDDRPKYYRHAAFRNAF